MRLFVKLIGIVFNYAQKCYISYKVLNNNKLMGGAKEIYNTHFI